MNELRWQQTKKKLTCRFKTVGELFCSAHRRLCWRREKYVRCL